MSRIATGWKWLRTQVLEHKAQLASLDCREWRRMVASGEQERGMIVNTS
jgi:hypothetical protein